MFTSLLPDLIGIRVDVPTGAALAARHGFDGFDLRLTQCRQEVEQIGGQGFRSLLQSHGLKPGYCSVLPGKISCDDTEWEAGLAALPDLAKLAAECGYTRTATVVLPFHPDLAYADCFAMHRSRLAEAMPVLRDHGLDLALEYVSPISRRQGQGPEFIFNLSGMLELCEAGGPGAGLLLDSFHWHCAGEGVDDIRALSASQVVVVHVNDLVAGRTLDQQVVHERELPGVSGLIALDGFLGALAEIGYDGPVTCEPTHPRWADADAESSAAQTGQAMQQMMSQVGSTS